MSFHNFTRKADRLRKIKEATEELAAIDAGTWPRTSDEWMRYMWAETPRAEYARKCLVREIEWLQTVPERIESGQLDAGTWEA